MTTIKHNFSTMFEMENPLTGLIVEVNNATNGWIIYSILILIAVVSFYVFSKRTQDTAKSLLYSGHVISILSIILFFGGKIAGYTLIHEIVLLTILIIEGVGLAAIYYARMNQQ